MRLYAIRMHCTWKPTLDSIKIKLVRLLRIPWGHVENRNVYGFKSLGFDQPWVSEDNKKEDEGFINVYKQEKRFKKTKSKWTNVQY